MAPPEVRKSRMDLGIVVVIGFGLLIGYMACLYGNDFDIKSLVAFGVWSVAAILVGFMILLFYKAALIGFVLVMALLWWRDDPIFRSASADVQGVRSDLCGLITFESEGLPVKEWIC